MQREPHTYNARDRGPDAGGGVVPSRGRWEGSPIGGRRTHLAAKGGDCMEAIDDDHGKAGLGVVGDEAPHRRLGVEVLGLLV